MTWTMWAALIVVVGTVWALIKRYETRLVLLTSGSFLWIRWPRLSNLTNR